VAKSTKKKRKPKAGKGSEYERKMAKTLSLWWSNGHRDDIFWRSTTSGGRATERAKKGLKTSGQQGDIAAIHPSGRKLLDICTIELKCGYFDVTIQDLLDLPKHHKTRVMEGWLNQAETESRNAEAVYWIMIIHRTGRKDLVLCPTSLLLDLEHQGSCLLSVDHPHFGLSFFNFELTCLQLETFLEEVPARYFKRLHRHLIQEKVERA